MRHTTLLLPLLVVTMPAVAEVVELSGDELLGTYVQGISIGQEVTDALFPADDEEARKLLADQVAARGETVAAITARNQEALTREASVLDRLRGIDDAQTRDLAEDAVLLTGAGEVFRLDLDRIAAETGIPVPAVNNSFNSVRGNLLEVMPVTTGYQFEFNSRF